MGFFRWRLRTGFDWLDLGSCIVVLGLFIRLGVLNAITRLDDWIGLLAMPLVYIFLMSTRNGIAFLMAAIWLFMNSFFTVFAVFGALGVEVGLDVQTQTLAFGTFYCLIRAMVEAGEYFAWRATRHHR